MALAGAATGRNASSTLTLPAPALKLSMSRCSSAWPRIGDRPDADGFRLSGRGVAGVEFGVEFREAVRSAPRANGLRRL